MPYQFPDTTHLPKGDDGTPIMGGSIGSNRIFDKLRLSAGSSESPRWDLYLINIYTLARNAYAKGIAFSGLEAMVDHDADLYMTFIGAYANYRQQTNPVVLFYAPDYRALPENALRIHTGQNAELDALYIQLRRRLPTSLTELTEDRSTRKFLVATTGSTYPHKQLPGYIRSIYDGRRSQGAIGTVMITHCPVDLHLYKAIGSLILLESYTAAIWPVTEFGRKLTRDVKVPFNTITHRAFGDDVHLQPLLKGKHRTTLIELADKNRWAIKTETEIMEDIVKTFPEITRTMLNFLRL